MKVIIAGGRVDRTTGLVYGKSLEDMYEAIDSAVRASGLSLTEVVCGMAPGVDLLGRAWARDNGIACREFPPNWSEQGKAAGMIRNRQMAEYAEGLIAIHDGRSPGTANMISVATKLGLKVYVHRVAQSASPAPAPPARIATYTTVDGDLFAQNVAAIVNPVNCVGVMGAGLALAFRERHPNMYAEYQRACAAGDLRPGQIHTYEVRPGRWIINFPTKDHWRDPSQLEFIVAGLKALATFANKQRLGSIALPALGCGLGGLPISAVEPLIANAASRMPSTTLTLVRPFPRIANRLGSPREMQEAPGASKGGTKMRSSASPTSRRE